MLQHSSRACAVAIALALAAVFSKPHPASAEGALAVGSTGNPQRDGIAIGTSWNYTTRSQAVAEALATCRNPRKSSAKAAAACDIVEAFTKKCVAIAYDPKPGTPGEGWAVDADKSVAESRAMANCRATAGQSRRAFCEIAQSHCDEHN